ncbi:hypothetical protein HIM_00124 [Hirsutella minnesotensis 3608]|nr:hypothetical protein HIM_00124 [Hirsutella minnesotensis 3608]
MALRTDILHGYRHLHRALMQAVQFQAPWRFVARDQLREAFRERGASWSASGAQRTLWFLQAAAREKGIEHKVLKNLLRVRQERINEGKAWRLVLHESKKK